MVCSMLTDEAGLIVNVKLVRAYSSAVGCFIE